MYTRNNQFSANILKLFDIIARHLEKFPEDSERFPNFDSSSPITLAKGSSKPLGGELHTAKYFHGKRVVSLLEV